ncbi:MAG: TolC family protein, partial [Bacteroidales bacterium]|nr:TolC family protein [Bacteroidales bacterium]
RQDLDLVYSVMSSFYNLLQVQKRRELSETNLQRQEEAYLLAKNKFAAGLIKEVDVLQMEVDLAEAQNSFEMSLINQQSLENSFKELIGLNISDSVVLSMDMLDYKPVIVDPDKAIELAMKNRLEIREQEIQLELRQMSIKRQRAQGLPSASLTAYFEKSGVSELGNDGEITTSFQNVTKDYLVRPQNYGVGLTVSVPILDFGENKARVRAAEANLQKARNQQEQVRRNIESEVLNLVSEVNTSLKRLQLLEKNIEVAEKSFEITRARYADGDIDSQALALERDRLNNAYTTHLSAYITYQLKLADLMRNTFYDFVNDVEIE